MSILFTDSVNQVRNTNTNITSDQPVNLGISVWARVTSQPLANTTVALYAFLTADNIGAVPGFLAIGRYLDVLGIKRVLFAINGITGGVSIDVPFTLSTNVWYHFFIQKTGNDTSFYIDNDLKGTGTSGTPGIFGGGNGLRIGTFRDDPITGNVWPGEFSEFAIFESTLSISNRFLISSGLKGMPLFLNNIDLKIYLPMTDKPHGDSADGAIIRDWSGNGQNAIGDGGANNTGIFFQAEDFLNYPVSENDYLSNVPIPENINLAGGYNNNLSGGFE